MGERQERGPHRHSTDVVDRAVDRVDDPLRVAAVVAELLAEYTLAATRRCDQRANRLFRCPVGFRHRREVRLRVDAQVERAEPCRGQRVRRVRQREREGEVGVHSNARPAASTSASSPGRPTTWTPLTASAGQPRALNGNVYSVIAARTSSSTQTTAGTGHESTGVTST